MVNQALEQHKSSDAKATCRMLVKLTPELVDQYSSWVVIPTKLSRSVPTSDLRNQKKLFDIIYSRALSNSLKIVTSDTFFKRQKGIFIILVLAVTFKWYIESKMTTMVCAFHGLVVPFKWYI